MNAAGPVTVREVMTVLRRWQVRLLAGEAGISRLVTWASTMRARLPAFEGLQGGEIAMLALAGICGRSMRRESRYHWREVIRAT